MIKRALQPGEKLYVKTLNNAWIPVTFAREELLPCFVVKTQTGGEMTVQKKQVITEEEFSVRCHRQKDVRHCGRLPDLYRGGSK